MNKKDHLNFFCRIYILKGLYSPKEHMIKAGNIVCHLPEEALFDSSVVAISKKWIIENFIDFVYPDVINFEEIRVSSHYQI